jgi:hypothetical protein
VKHGRIRPSEAPRERFWPHVVNCGKAGWGGPAHSDRPCFQHWGSPYQNTTANLVHQKVVTKAMLVNRYAMGKSGASVTEHEAKRGSIRLKFGFHPTFEWR